MFTHSGSTFRFMTIIFLVMSSVTFILGADDLFAQRRDTRRNDPPRVTRERDRRDYRAPRFARHRERRQVISPRFARERHVVSTLPRGYKRYWHRHVPFFFYGGTFYRPVPLGFSVVLPPLGIVVDTIPAGYVRISIGGIMYYSYGGVFYRRVPYGYAVVEAPPEINVVEDVPDIVAPEESAAGKASVTVPILNVRSGPGLSYPIIYQMHKGYILDVHGRSYGWLYVELPNGEFGWVMSQFTYMLEAPGSG